MTTYLVIIELEPLIRSGIIVVPLVRFFKDVPPHVADIMSSIRTRPPVTNNPWERSKRPSVVHPLDTTYQLVHTAHYS